MRKIVYFQIGYRQASGALLALNIRAGMNFRSMELAALPTIRKGLARIASGQVRGKLECTDLY
eukprot:COSAG01_NODE_32191_length_585_cov_0.555556_1_plen_62_part_10